MHRIFVFLLALIGATQVASAADWPRFRGPNGTGVVDGTLPPIDPKQPHWKVAIPGKGNGSPIVVTDKVFLQSTSEDSKKRVLYCLDLASGKTLWTRDVPGRTLIPKKDGLHAKNSPASSTPASDGKSVFSIFWDGDDLSLNAFDLDGSALWAKSLGGFKSQHGAALSPTVHNGKVFVNIDQDRSAVVMAFDAKDGSKVWQAEREGHLASYTTPQLLERAGKPVQLIVASTTGVDSYNPDTGSVNWHYTISWPDAKKLRMIGCPVFVDDLIVCYTGEGGNSRYMVAIKPESSGDISNTAKVWDVKKQCPYVPSMLTRDGNLFWIHDDGRAGCTEAKTGKVLWEETLFSSPATASPILVGKQILAISEMGQCAILTASPEYDLTQKIELREKVFASPALANGKLLIRTDKHLYCFTKS